ncbi:MAG: molybdopterin-dependent oxidoreductase [Pseudomonadota bacterium]
MSVCKTTCPYCGVGCGVDVKRDGDLIAVSGDIDHPANRGKLCVKGSALGETLVPNNRLVHPFVEGVRESWDSALETLTTRLMQTIDRFGPGSVGFYLSGQLLTEDYYVANKLMKGFIGGANVDTNSRLCMASAVAAYKRSLGADYVPCTYDDLDDAEMIVMVGSNAAWTHPVLYQRIEAAKTENPHKRIVLIDPRRTATADLADQHLAIQPGSDGFLFGGLLRYTNARDLIDSEWVQAHTSGAQEALAAVADLSLEVVSRHTGLSIAQLEQFYAAFANTERVLTFYSQGINQSASGTDDCNAIINCHLALGRIGQPGMGPFSITGQPNAMGGREVGGLATQLAAHMDFTAEDVDRVGRFWGSDRLAQAPGLKAVDLFRAAADGDIKFLWIMATNPAVSLPDSAAVKTALERCETVVVSDCVRDTETNRYAHILLPAMGWGEKSGTVTNSERTISRQRQFLPPAGEARADWHIVTDVARRMGFADAFPFESPADVFREHAGLSAFENNGARDFDIGALADITDADYENLPPTRWPLPADGRSEEHLPAFFADRRMRLVSVVPRLPDVDEDSSPSTREFVVNSGRLRDQWHTMTRTGLAGSLARHRRFLSASMNPVDLERIGAKAGEVILIQNATGRVTAIAEADAGTKQGEVFLPIHWSDCFSSEGKVSGLFPGVTDPISGQPQSKYARASIRPLKTSNWTYMVVADDSGVSPVLDSAVYWSQVRIDGGLLMIVAGGDPEVIASRIQDDLGEQRPLSLSSPKANYRIWAGDRVNCAMFSCTRCEDLPEPSWLESLLTRELPRRRWQLLAGYDPGVEDQGPLVCSCWEVGEKAIRAAIRDGADSVSEISESLRCGTRCGSCLPEVRSILTSETAAPAPDEQTA